MEWRLFDEGTVPECTTPEWYDGRDAAPHLEQEGHRQRLSLTADFVRRAILLGTRRVCDLGAGDGGLLSLVAWMPLDAAFGYDLQISNIEAASRRHVNVSLRDVVSDVDWESSITQETCLVATEMLEHLVDPHDFIRRMRRTGALWAVISSPYTETGESHYEYHTWAWDRAGYRALAEDNGWRVVEEDTAWISQVLLLERA